MQNIIKKDKSLPAILNGVRQAVANAENQPDELTLMSMRVVGAKRRLRNKAIVNNIAREQAEQSKIIPIAGD